MATELRNLAGAAIRPPVTERSSDCHAAQISETLLGLQLDGVTGIAYVEVVSERGAYERSVIFRNGLVIYVGETIPTPYEFVTEIAQYLHIGVLETVLEFAVKRTSVQSVLQAMVEIGVLKWPDIAAAARKHAIAAFEGLPAVADRLMFTPGTPTFDLCYCEGIVGFNVDTLLLEAKLLQRANSANPFTSQGPSDLQPTILSVDDSPIAQALIKRTLGRQYRIETCNSAFEAFRVLSDRDDVALMLLDLTMPSIDGLELCRMLRRVEKFKGLPVIILTARDGLVDRVRGNLAGATHYLTKPVKAADLNAIVSQYVVA